MWKIACSRRCADSCDYVCEDNPARVIDGAFVASSTSAGLGFAVAPAATGTAGLSSGDAAQASTSTAIFKYRVASSRRLEREAGGTSS